MPGAQTAAHLLQYLVRRLLHRGCIDWHGMGLCVLAQLTAGVLGMQVLTSELFGLQHFASNHSVMHVAPTLGGLIMSATLAGNLYQRAGDAHDDPRGQCFGPDCYRCCRHSFGSQHLPGASGCWIC